MKQIKLIFLFLLLALLLCACNNKDTANIRITCSGWSGWDENYKSSQLEEIYTVSKGDVISLEGFCDFSVTITSISTDKVAIKTSTPMSNNTDGTITLNTNMTKFVIYKGEIVELYTPTTDAGNIYIFELVSAP